MNNDQKQKGSWRAYLKTTENNKKQEHIDRKLTQMKRRAKLKHALSLSST